MPIGFGVAAMPEQATRRVGVEGFSTHGKLWQSALAGTWVGGCHQNKEQYVPVSCGTRTSGLSVAAVPVVYLLVPSQTDRNTSPHPSYDGLHC